jgi:hypothetical protein
MVWPEPWMSISSQLPPVQLAPGSGILQMLAQAAGGPIEAQVIALQPNGQTQVQIAGQMFSLHMPQPVSVGTTLSLAVRQVEGQLQLALLGQVPASVGAGLPTAGAQAPVSGSMPAATVHLSAEALAKVSTASEGSAGVQAGRAGVVTASEARPFPLQPAQGAPVPAAALPSAAGSVGPSVQQVPTTAVSTMPVDEPGSPLLLPGNLPGAAVGRTAIPYAIAAPASPQLLAPSAPSVAPDGTLAPVTRAAGTGTTGQEGSDQATVAVAGRSSLPAAAQGATPEAALAHMVQRALPRQDSIVGLTAALSQVLGRVALPEPVVKAALQVLAHRLPLDAGKLDGAAIGRAVINSGLFQEAKIAAGQPETARGDLKTALLSLQRGLGAWLGQTAAVDQVSKLPPPLRGAMPRAKGGETPLPPLPDDPQAAGKVLLERTDAALSRLRLHQSASLPEPAQRQEGQWSLDLPVTIGGQQNILQMQIHRDPEERDDPQAERGWQVRFAIHLGEPGEVGAQISLRGTVTGVMIWAENAETARLLERGLGDLRADLEAVGLRAGAVLVRSGAPAGPAGSARHFVDETR